MTIYLVICEVFYRSPNTVFGSTQHIVGIYSKLSKAIDIAREHLRPESHPHDDYHVVSVLEVKLDQDFDSAKEIVRLSSLDFED